MLPSTTHPSKKSVTHTQKDITHTKSYPFTVDYEIETRSCLLTAMWSIYLLDLRAIEVPPTFMVFRILFCLRLMFKGWCMFIYVDFMLILVSMVLYGVTRFLGIDFYLFKVDVGSCLLIFLLILIFMFLMNF